MVTDKYIIEDLLNRKGVSKRDVAKALGISESSLYNKLSGRFEFTASELKLLAELLEVKVDFLFTS